MAISLDNIKKKAEAKPKDTGRSKKTSDRNVTRRGRAEIVLLDKTDHTFWVSAQEFYNDHKSKIGKSPIQFIWLNGRYKVEEDGTVTKVASVYGKKEVHEYEFWQEVTITKGEREGEKQTKIIRRAFLDFLHKNGYRNTFVKGEIYIIRVLKNILTEVYDPTYEIKQMVKEYLLSRDEEKAYDAWLGVQDRYASKNFLQNLEEIESNFLKADAETTHLFFQNGVLYITAQGMEIIPYSKIDGYVWETDIINSHFEVRQNITDSDYFEFLSCALIGSAQGKDKLATQVMEKGILNAYKEWIEDVEYDFDTLESEEEKNTLQVQIENIKKLASGYSTIGYLSDPFKNKAEPKMIVAVDAVKNAGGGGKSSFFNFLAEGSKKKVRKIQKLDGKTLTTSYQWWLNNLKLYDNHIIHVQDAQYDLSIESFYNLANDDVFISEKGSQPAMTIPFSESAKIGISTNYIIKGLFRSSSRRRVFILEIQNYFNDKYSAQDHLGREMFGIQWDDEQWMLFYNVIAQSMQLFKYIQSTNKANRGLIPFPNTGYADREFDINCPPWAQAYFDEIVMDITKDEWPEAENRTRTNKIWISEFTETCQEDINNLKNRFYPSQFWRYLKFYCDYYGIQINPGMPQGKTDRRRVGGIRQEHTTLVWSSPIQKKDMQLRLNMDENEEAAF
ncbi:MAG: hypothetical protein AB8B69_16550 [Chitinophagales bacterium]